MSDLNLVTAEVSIAGTSVHFKRLILSQEFYAHHRCEIEIDYEELGNEKWMGDAIKFIKFIGQDINITFRHRQSGEENLFVGIVTNVSHSGYHGSQNSIIITAASPTILLDGKPAMDSFTDLPLQQIVTEAVANSGNGGSVIANPKFKSKLDYICQSDESCWQLLLRLGWEFGEVVTYNGQNLYFGKRYEAEETIEYDKEMTYFDLSANLVPSKFNRRHYLKHEAREMEQDDPSYVPGVHGYLQVSKKRSESVYTSDAVAPLKADINSQKDLDDLALAEKSRAVGKMLIIRGKSQTCKVRIGGSVKVEMPKRMGVYQSVDTFLITKVTHLIDQEGHYSNSFEGCLDELEAIPMEEPKLPTAHPHIATVVDNADPRGRGLVKVQTGWQKLKNKTTNWIRVQTPDSGKSDLVPENRGFVHIPEVGDTVMVGYEYGDPSRPFVMGSIFSELVSKGGGTNNRIKSLTTRSGITVVFDDDENKGSVTVKDPSGNVVKFDGNGNTTFTVPDVFTVNAKDIKLNASNSINLKAEAEIGLTAQNSVTVTSETDTVSVTAEGTLSLKSNGGDLTLKAESDMSLNAENISIAGTSTLKAYSSDTDIM